MTNKKHLEEMVVGLYDKGILGYAESREEYTPLKSGRESPHYANFRGAMSLDPRHSLTIRQQIRVRDALVNTCAEALDSADLDFHHLVPIPQAVTQLGGAVALKAWVSSLNVRVKETEKGYGKHKPVEGDFIEGDVVLGFDDVVTTGEAKKEFLEPITLAGLVCRDFFVILDREEGGRTNLQKAGYGLVSVTGVAEVNEILLENNRINSQQFQFVQEYLAEYGD